MQSLTITNVATKAVGAVPLVCSSVAAFLTTPPISFFLWHRSKQHTYDDVVEKVAQQLGLEDASKIRLTSHNCYSQQPKPQPIKYRGVERLSDMLVHYNQVGGSIGRLCWLTTFMPTTIFSIIMSILRLTYCDCIGELLLIVVCWLSLCRRQISCISRHWICPSRSCRV